jgi:hypothetical protein
MDFGDSLGLPRAAKTKVGYDDKTQQAGYYLPGQWTNVRNV